MTRWRLRIVSPTEAEVFHDPRRLLPVLDATGAFTTIGLSIFRPSGRMPDAAALACAVFDALAEVNQDFRESRRMVPAAKQPTVAFHAPGSGPFEGADIRVKRVNVRAAEAGGGHRRRTAGIVNGRTRSTINRQGAPT